jgi:tetratricopeptide (TPR) repeat protein
LRIRLQGPDHPGAIAARGELVYALFDLGRTPEALALVEENLERVTRTLPPTDRVAREARHRAASVLLVGGGRAMDALRAVLPTMDLEDLDDQGGTVPRYALVVMALSEVGGPDATALADRLSVKLMGLADRTLDPTQSSYWSALEVRGLALAAAGRCTEALSFYDRAIDGIERDPTESNTASWVLARRARCLAALGRSSAAERDLREGVEVLLEDEADTPWISEPSLELALFLARAGAVGEARELVAHALEVLPDATSGLVPALGHYVLGLSAADPTAAEAEFEEARRALGRGIDQCRLGDEIARALGETPSARRLADVWPSP